MLRFTRPDKHQCAPDFDDHVAAARARVAEFVSAGEVPEKGFFERKENKRWSRYKKHFANAQHGKCGYCETYIQGSQYGDIEHYAPKARVQQICQWAPVVPPDGQPLTPTHKVEPQFGHGYHCLAYDWDNYLYACQSCNQRHKRGLFPVRRRNGPPCSAPLAEEQPRLLNPYHTEVNPADHLEFDALGQIRARGASARGRATIDTCRLDREELRTQRASLAERVHEWLDQLEWAVERDDDEEITRIEQTLLKQGARTNPFAGMVRAIFEKRMGVAWDELTYPDEHANPSEP